MRQYVLVIDDEQDIRELVSDILEDAGIQTIAISSAAEALNHLQHNPNPQAIILDIWLEGSEVDGIGLLKLFKKSMPNIPVIMISGHANIETAVKTIKIGAYDFIEKPFQADKLIHMVNRAIESQSLLVENTALKNNIIEKYSIIGESKEIKQIRQQCHNLVNSNGRILITGERGVGKRALAKYIHYSSDQTGKRLFFVNCNSTSEQEIIGWEKSVPNSGYTIILDEITNLSPTSQDALIKYLSASNNKIISTSSINKEQVKETINKTLFARLSPYVIDIPPLRKRVIDIPVLTEHFIEEQNIIGCSGLQFNDEALSYLTNYTWPMNTKQLKNAVEWALMMYEGRGEITVDCLPVELTGKTKSDDTDTGFTIKNEIFLKQLKNAREEFEREYLRIQLNRFSGNISKTASFVGMDRTALHRKIKSLSLKAEVE
jgi:two-component system nitrogen regulation response regulator NtrX